MEFFANSGTDSNGNVEGERFLGSATVSTDNTGNAAFSSLLSGSVSVGESVTATATDNATGDTSEFSQAVGAQAAVSQNFVVTTLADENDPAATVASPGGGGLSLREALALAAGNPGPDSITFASNLTGGPTPGVNDGHLVLTNGELVIDSDVTISGDAVGTDPVADITIDANHLSSVLHIVAGTSSLDALVVTGGYVYGGYGYSGSGGGIKIENGAAADISHSTISGNAASSAGGIWSDGTLTLTSSTIAGNANYGGGGGGGGKGSSGGAGGLYIGSQGIATLVDVTVYGNSGGRGGGIYNHGTATLTNTTITGNSSGGGKGASAGGIFNSGSYYGTATLTDSIVAGNSGGSKGGSADIRGSYYSTPTFHGLNIVGIGSDTDASDHVIQTASLGNLFDHVVARPFGYSGQFLAGGLARVRQRKSYRLLHSDTARRERQT